MMLVSPDAVHELVKEQRIDGLLATPAAAKELALPKNFPCVLLGQPDQPNPNVSWVDNDLLLGAQMAVDHLCHQHYAAISFLGVSCNGADSLHRRLEGYRQSLPAGIPPRVFPTDGTSAGARQVVSACLGTGLTVPDDIGIVTFHNRPMAEYLAPSLSVLRLDGERFGAEAVRMLVERINCPALPPEQLLIPPQLVVRESSVSRNPLFPLRWDDVSGRDF